MIWNYYRKHGRDLLWRRTRDPYKIFVSEVLLQQTQVSRVLEKYPKFLKAFPDFKALARAPLRRVLRVWQGMGYNRRALYLKRSAEIIVRDYKGKIPQDPAVLAKLPGIGKNTAGAIVTFAFNKSTVFIETNIRRVFIYHFFQTTRDVRLRRAQSRSASTERFSFSPRDLRCAQGHAREAAKGSLNRTSRVLGSNNQRISDSDILPLVAKMLDRKNPREWYWALMDYGSALALSLSKDANPNRKSKHYIKQSRLEGSNRQLRGQILRIMIKNNGRFGVLDLARRLKRSTKEIARVLRVLEDEKLIRSTKRKFGIA